MGNYRSDLKLIAILLFAAVIIFLTAAGCGSQPTPDPFQNLALTQTAISIQQTQTFMAEGTGQGISQTSMPESATQQPPTAPPQATEPPYPPTDPPPPPTEPPPTTGQTGCATTFEEWIKVANILDYEDMSYYPKYKKFVQTTLDKMDLNYTYVGSAIGEFKKKLLLETPPGGWDLIIAAAEAKNIPSVLKGEYFTYLNDALEDGTPVILELWYLDKVSEGSIEPILEKCGIEWESNWKNVRSRNQIMWPLSWEDPILNYPNANLSFTKTTSIWADTYDIGDLVEISPGGDARLLLGLSSDKDQVHGTLTTCMGDHLILQTFSSHQLNEDISLDLWENYIYNALKVRYADICP